MTIQTGNSHRGNMWLWHHKHSKNLKEKKKHQNKVIKDEKPKWGESALPLNITPHLQISHLLHKFHSWGRAAQSSSLTEATAGILNIYPACSRLKSEVRWSPAGVQMDQIRSRWKQLETESFYFVGMQRCGSRREDGSDLKGLNDIRAFFWKLQVEDRKLSGGPQRNVSCADDNERPADITPWICSVKLMVCLTSSWAAETCRRL